MLDRFEEVGLVDDAAFAQAWVQTRHAGRGLARRALAHELRQRGAAQSAADAALGEVSAQAEEERARALVRGRLAATARLEHPVRVRRLAGLLARKGYPPGLALRVVRDELAASEQGDGAEVELPAGFDEPGDLDALAQVQAGGSTRDAGTSP